MGKKTKKDGLYEKFENINLEKNAHHLSIEEDGTYLTFFLHDLSPQAQDDVLKFLGVKNLDELGDKYTPLLKIQEPEHLESSAYERLMVADKKVTAQFGEFELFFDDLTTRKKNELLAALGMNDPSEGNFDVVPIAIINIEPYEPQALQIPVEWEGEKEEVIHRHMGIKSKREGEKYHPPTTEELKVSEVEEVTTTRKSAFDRFMEKKEAMFKTGWTIEKQKISEGEHKRRLDKIRAHEKDIARELNQEEAEDLYYKSGKKGISRL